MRPLLVVRLAAGCIQEPADGGFISAEGGATTDDVAGDDGVDENADTDGDGLTDLEEADLGTDPASADSDGDGFADLDEVDAGTNPLYVYSHAYEGGYAVGYCDAEPVPTGPSGSNDYGPMYKKGDVVENFTLGDQYGEDVSLYSFCGENVMLVFSAFW